jgi:hypothetical protein
MYFYIDEEMTVLGTALLQAIAKQFYYAAQNTLCDKYRAKQFTKSKNRIYIYYAAPIK